MLINNDANQNLLRDNSVDQVQYDIITLNSLIFDLIKIHNSFSYNMREINNLNLNKKLVKHILNQIDETNTYLISYEFRSILNEYVSELEFLTIDIDLEYTYNKLDFRLRIKQLESIIYKLIHYNTGKKEKGEIPLNKCLNDLLGFRVCVEGFDHDCSVFKEMCDFIAKDYKIRYRNSSKGEYRATHVYFYGDSNKNFPWELQIWLPEDFKTNYESHEEHKQEYKKSAKIHKEAFK
ncbi:hypothetical protein RVS70_09500 [Virgibacillus sp. M23]|uniref:hypothetical protein n=1 Tax=Virgibacillus sp. M23 TaxID=3079030 RepID=UPI002A91C2EC|nr:hypothetical protein [Virgibacillus sp. M23]MDY7044439.1 hypothetical protein [Virgibacillus sp. M23]